MAPLYVRSSGRISPPHARTARRTPAAAPLLPYGLPAPSPGAPVLPAGVSLCMIVRDEERFIAGCLASVADYVDEICVVDTGSTDRTVEIALGFGARVEHRVWRRDFGWARNEALAMASKRWIFVLDADEELDSASRDPLRAMRDVPADVTGLWVRCNNLSDDYKGTGISSHALVRFFPNNPRVRYLSPVHEFITLDGKATGIDARTSPLSITHHGYLSEIVTARNKSQRNLELVRTATENDPTEAFNWYNLGTTTLLCGDPAGAIVALETMRELVGEKQRGFIPNALAQLADLYTERGDYDRAILIANESLCKAPNFANAHFALGRAHAKAKRYAQAREAFEAAIADKAHAARQFIVDDEVSVWKAHSEIGSSYGNENNDAKALEWFDRALQNRPGVVPVRLNRAKALERLGRYAEADAMFAGLADDEPGDVHSVDYINFLLRRNDYERAALRIEQALTFVTPRTRATLLVTAARIAERRGVGDVATLLERAHTADPGASDAIEALEAWYTAGGNADALAALHAAELDAPPTLTADYERRARRLLGLGRLTEAETIARAGLAGAPADPALRYALAAALVQTDRKDEALAELERIGLDGDIGLRACFLRAVVLGDLGQLTAAVEAIDTVIERAPREVDARLQRFRWLETLGEETAAEATLRDGLALRDARIATELATWLLRKGRLLEAKEVAERALTP